MLPFSPDVKMIPAYFFFFFSFQGFSERISCGPNPDSWSLNRREAIMIYSFLSLPFSDRAKTSGSVRIRIRNTNISIQYLHLILIFIFIKYSYNLCPQMIRVEVPTLSLNQSYTTWEINGSKRCRPFPSRDGRTDLQRAKGGWIM